MKLGIPAQANRRDTQRVGNNISVQPVRHDQVVTVDSVHQITGRFRFVFTHVDQWSTRVVNFVFQELVFARAVCKQ
ncbi:hypothetical protein D3C80_2188390 [compost metagenome]